MSNDQKIIPHYYHKDYLNWEGRWELIEGHPIAMSPLPVPLHQLVEGNLHWEFKNALRTGCKECKVYLPLDYKISDDTIVQPDLLVLCKKITKPFLDFPPVLVVEILSPSTMLRDKNTKFSLYEQEGILYYLIVDAEKKIIDIFKLINGQYQLQTHSNQFEFSLTSDCNISIVLESIWE